ncbi:MAG TPA: Rrf2 family transcriptional regulator [Desulfobacterales bacterium]|nr:Rrf2 family transcriptional regulator [Desulfobacterales bacterium]
MKLSTRSRYGTRLMIQLAKNYGKGPLQIGDISEREGISVKYLEQLIIALKKAKLIKSVRGPKGGHSLTKSPRKITIGEIVRAVEGHTELADCVTKPQLCDRSDSCPTRNVWESATKAMYKELDKTTLWHMIKNSPN